MAVVLLVGTRKGAFIYRGDAARRSWTVEGPHHLGAIVHHLVLDPRDKRTLLMAARTGHLGPTLFRSTDLGQTWTEAKSPPKFPRAEGGKGRVLDHVFWLTPGAASEPGVWWAGSSPQGLFRSEDGGDTWESVAGFNDHPKLLEWTGGEQDGTPDGPKLHSVVVDPRDPRHIYISMSSGGSFESVDQGGSWRPLNRGIAAVFPLPNPDFGHDPHCLVQCPSRPDRLYQQNHCGIYRLDRPDETWVRIGEAMPGDVGDIGFPMVVHPRNADVAWVFPMDGGSVWPRTSPGGRPAVFRTADAGASWERQDRGFPLEQAWWTVKRQAMTCDAGDPVGVYAGTTSGEVWGSVDEGATWTNLARHLPHIYSVVAAEV